MLIDIEHAKRLGRETVAILQAGNYTAASGRTIVLDRAARRMSERHDRISAGSSDAAIRAQRARTRIAVENASVLDVGRRMAGDGAVAALNFASAAVPGGGFQWGALAQEESIARSSGLFHALDGRAMYVYHCARRDPMYSD